MPRCMHVALDELQLRLGTWAEIITVKRTTTIHKALLKFLGKTLSCLPVLDDNKLVVDVLTKSDVMNLIVDEGPNEIILQKTVQDALQSRPEVKFRLCYCIIMILVIVFSVALFKFANFANITYLVFEHFRALKS